jgi:hypothetical protein
MSAGLTPSRVRVETDGVLVIDLSPKDGEETPNPWHES